MVNGTGQDSVRSDHYLLQCSVNAVSCKDWVKMWASNWRDQYIFVSSICSLPAQSGLISSKSSYFVVNIFFALETVYIVSLYLHWHLCLKEAILTSVILISCISLLNLAIHSNIIELINEFHFWPCKWSLFVFI